VAFANLGNAYHQLKKEDEAAAAYQKAIALKPMEAAYHNNLGLSLGASKKLDEAKASFEMAASLDPLKSGDYLFNEGAMYNNNGDYPKAIEAFKKTLDKDPNNKSAMLQIALSYMGTEATMPQAVPILEKFLTLKPTAADAELAKAYLEAIKTTAPTEYKSDKAIADEKKAADKKAADDAKAAAAKAPKAGTTKK
jgi:superkiller protein 3